MGFVSDPIEPQSIFGQKVRGTANIKWKFFMMGVIYKTCCAPKDPYHQYPLFYHLCVLASLVAPCIFYLESFLGTNKMITNFEESIFPGTMILSFITPKVLPEFVFVFACLVFLTVIIALFVSCFFSSYKILKYEKLLNMNIQFIMLPLMTGTCVYCIHYILTHRQMTLILFILCASFVIAFIFYALIAFVTSLSASYTLINPNPLFSNWFGHMGVNMPAYSIIVSFLYFIMVRFSSTVQIILISVVVIISIIGSSMLFYAMPYTSFAINDLYITAFWFNFMFGIVAIILNIFKINIGVIFYGLLPPIIYIVHYLAALTSHLRRTKFIQLLKEPDQVDDLTTEYLAEIFGAIEDEQTFQMMIKIGLQSGSKTVISKAFAGYVVSRFPKSNWMIIYVTYLYSVIWGMDDDTYQYFLHLLSLDSLPMEVQMPIFETLYCYMQLGGSRSPIISEELKKFQEITVQFAESYKRFWGSIAESKEDLYYNLLQIYQITQLGEVQIDKMTSSFPFCSEVCFQQSIFLADFKKNFKMASIAASKGNEILQNGSAYITSSLSARFRPFYKGAEHVTIQEQKTELDQYTFLSVSEHASDFAVRHPNNSINDDYLKKNSNSYTAQRNHFFHETPFLNKSIHNFGIAIRIIEIIYLIGFIYYISYFFTIHKKTFEEIAIFDSMSSSREFIDTIETLFYDLSTLYNTTNKNFENLLTGINATEFRLFVVDHINLIYYKVNDYLVNISHFSKYINIKGLSLNVSTMKKLINMELRDESSDFQETWQTLFQLRCDTINATLRYINDSRKLLQNRYDIHYKRDHYRRISTFFVVVIMSAIFTAVLYNMFKGLQDQLFVIFKTLQRPVRQTVEREFDNLMASKDPTICLPDLQYYIPYYIFIWFSAFFYLATCISEIIVVDLTNKAPIPTYYDANLLDPLVSGKGYYAHLTMEYSLENGRKNASTFSEKHDSNICAHNYFNRAKIMPFLYPYAEYYTSIWSYALLFVTCTISAGFFILFVYRARSLLGVFKATRYLLFSIPTKVGRANPVLYKVITGRPIISDEVNAFLSEIEGKKGNFSFFGFIIVNDKNEVVETTDNVEGILGFLPENCEQIKDYLIKCEVSKEETDSFFLKHDENDILVCVDEGRDIDFVLQFTSEHTLFIKNENAAMGVGRKHNKKQLIDFKLKSFVREKLNATNEAGCLMMEGISLEEVKQLYEIAKSYDKLKFIDARFKQLSFCFDFSCDKEIVSKQCVDFLKKSIPMTKQGRGIITAGGPFSTPKPRKLVEKSRFINKSSSNAVTGLLLIPFSKRIIVQKDLYELSGSTDSFEEKELSVTPNSSVTFCLL